MRHRLLTYLAPFVTLLPAAVGVAAQARSLSTAQIAKLATPATVTILNIDARGDTVSLGSGFIVSEDGVIVTNFHVMAGAASAVVVLADGQRYSRVMALDGDRDADIALVKIPGAGLPFLKTSNTLPDVGSRIVVIGSPLGLEATVSDGVVSGKRVTDGRELLQMSAPISHGSSGGPVIDERGEVVAVSTLYLAKGQSLNFAVPVRYAIGLLRQQPKPRQLAEVFGDAPAAQPGQATAARGEAHAFMEPPPAASTVRPGIAGIYWGEWQSVCEDRADAKPTYDKGLMILGAGDVGWIASGRVEDGSLGYPLSITRVSTSASGRVAVGLAKLVVDGYQTEKGLWLSMRLSDVEGCKTERDDMDWHLMTYPLSESTGLYHATVRTNYYTGGKTDWKPLDWEGDLAAMVVKDSVFIDVFLNNASGGNTSGTLRGAISSAGGFQLSFKNKEGEAVYLAGTLRAGRLIAKWTDVRKSGGYFTGTMSADRE